MKRIIFITENVNKFKELQNYLQNNSGEGVESSKNTSNICKISIEMIKPDVEINEIQSLNKEEIVINKLYEALVSSQHLFATKLEKKEDIWILVEDTSLCISKLGGFPGPFVKFFIQSLSLESIGNDNWGSEAQSYVNIAIGRVTHNENGHIGFSVVKSFDGVINGYIVKPCGTNGFGFDPIFQPVNCIKSSAEMSMTEKSNYNPRTLAFQKVLDYLK